MKILTLTGILMLFALGSTTFAEGVSDEDIKCDNNPMCLQSPTTGDEN